MTAASICWQTVDHRFFFFPQGFIFFVFQSFGVIVNLYSSFEGNTKSNDPVHWEINDTGIGFNLGSICWVSVAGCPRIWVQSACYLAPVWSQTAHCLPRILVCVPLTIAQNLCSARNRMKYYGKKKCAEVGNSPYPGSFWRVLGDDCFETRSTRMNGEKDLLCSDGSYHRDWT